MSSLARLLLAIVLATACIGLTTVAFAAIAISRHGTVSVDLEEEDGGRRSLALPGTLVETGVHLLPDEVIRDVLADAPELSRVLPAVRVACRELDDATDGVLVDIEAPDERVRIRKEDGHLVVEVDGAADDLEVRVPLATVQAVLDIVEPLVAADRR